MALNLNLDGVYIPSFMKLCNYKNLSAKKNFKLIGSAHNLLELKNKEKQGCTSIFIAPIFKTKKTNYFLDIARFNFIAKNTEKEIDLVPHRRAPLPPNQLAEQSASVNPIFTNNPNPVSVYRKPLIVRRPPEPPPSLPNVFNAGSKFKE